jgi:hypothetical protein
MKVLVACEESQAVCKAFREKGHEAYSCDIQECSGGHPEWHIQGDVLEVLNPQQTFPNELKGIEFFTTDGEHHSFVGKWDLIIAHPPCTFLTVTGNRWFNVERYGEKAIQRAKDREEAVEFFMAFVNANCEKIAIENPIGCMSTRYRKCDQVIQPYEHGHEARKSTCLWLKNLPLLKPTKIVDPEIYYYKAKNGSIKSDSKWRSKYSKEERAKMRSKTFEGIARAFAEQWGGENV